MRVLKKAFQVVLTCGFAASLSGAPVPPQQQSPSGRPAADIVSDNLERVAGTAEQILEVLNKDSGLMVEFKRLLAEDAGNGGQILEESDLSDGAINERLRQDLRTRVLATQLLRRYGYLVPKINPDSELATEHNLAMRERAVEADRAADRGNVPPQTVINVGQGTPSPGQVPSQARPVRPPLNAVDGVLDKTRPDVLTAPKEAGMELTQASVRQASTATATTSEDVSAVASTDAFLPPVDLPSAPASRPSRSGARMPVADFEPVRLERRPNPYADVPSLYDLYVQANSPNRKMERFGLEVFRNGTADPDILPMDLPVGPDYVVGPGDSLSVNLWGGVSQRLLRTVDREGRLVLPEVGPVLVAGRTLGDVQQEVHSVLRTQFRDVSADVSLLRLRTVRVYVVGDVAEPGAYDVSSLSTPLNALFAAGGVKPQGSLRRIQHYRGKQLVEELDAYDLLLPSIRSDLKRLEHGDTLLVPPIGPQVTVDGMVRRPAIYELHGEKSLAEVLDLAGGILPAAALRHIEVQRLEAHEKRTMLSLDLSPNSDPDAITKQLSAVAIRDGDEIHIFPIAPSNEDTVYLQGHVLRPGRYSYKPGMKLTDLIAAYSDLLPEPAPHYAEIVRLNPPDFHPSVESFDLSAALANSAAAPKIEPRDTVRIFSRYDFEPAPLVWVGGAVRAPGRYRTSGQAHFRDAIYLAGGLTPGASLDSGQLFRSMPDGTMKILSVNLRDALAGNPVDNVLLEPRDRILVHLKPKEVDPPSVSIKGEVAKPGRYPLADNMHVSDLIRTAGGFKRSAAAETADLTRYPASESGQPEGKHYPLNLAEALTGDVNQDLPLHDGDVLTIPQVPGWNDIGAVITVRGEVKNPGVYGIRQGERLSSLLERAGGFLPTAYPQAAILERVDVRQLQEKARQELIQRLEQETASVKISSTASVSEQATLQQAALQQRS